MLDTDMYTDIYRPELWQHSLGNCVEHSKKLWPHKTGGLVADQDGDHGNLTGSYGDT